MKICAPSVYCNLMELLNAIQHRAKLRRKHLVVQGHSHTHEEIAYAVKWSMRDEPAVSRLGVHPRGISFTGALRADATKYQRGRGRPIGERPSTGFGRRCVPASVRVSSSAPSEHRQRSAIIPVIPKALKISTKYVDNSVENSKPMKSDRCPALTSLIFAQNLGNYLSY
jgi:hypothetical protein